MSYSNRHHYGEHQQLGTGDFEPAYQSNAYPQIPRAPRAPAMSERHQMHSHREGVHQLAQTGPFRPIASSHFPPPATSRHAIPHAPSSLAPMSMATARGAVATGPYPTQTQDAMEAPARPSAKAGMSILFAGAIIGGLIGAVMHARQNAADAFAAAQQQTHEVAQDTGGAGPNPTVAGSSSAQADHVIAPPQKDANGKVADQDKADKEKADKEKKPHPKWGGWKPAVKGGAITTASAGATTDDDATDTKPVKSSKSKAASNKDDDGYTIASAGGDSGGDDTPSKPSKPAKDDAKPAKAEKPSKADKPTVAEAAPVKKASKGGDDAVSVLKAAMGATENSL